MLVFYNYLIKALGLHPVDAYKLTMEKYGVDLRSFR